MQEKDCTSRRRKEPVRFVLVNPAQTGDGSNTIHQVRSHAARWTWDKVRARVNSNDPQDEAQVFDAGSISNAAQRPQGAERDETPPQEVELETYEPAPPIPAIYQALSGSEAVVHVDTGGGDFRWRGLSNTPETRLVRHDIANPVWVQSTSNENSSIGRSLDAASLDPFQTYVEAPVSSGGVSISNKYALSVVWPGMMPGSTEGVRAWFRLSGASPALHSSMMFGSYSHQRMQWVSKRVGYFSSKDAKELGICEADSITKINLAIQDPAEAVSDAIILAVLCLATNDSPLEPAGDKESPFDAPLKSLQWLDIYGRLSPNLVHAAGLMQLVELKGGLDKIELPGLGAVISYSGVLGASRSLSRPIYPMMRISGAVQPALQELVRFRTFTGHGDDPLVGLQVTTEMKSIFQAARVYVSLVQDYLDAVPEAVNRTILCDARNLTQWHIMSLLPASQLATTTLQVNPIYEMCRLALIIFGVGVIFPLPPETAPLDQLARLLRSELEAYRRSKMSASESEIKVQFWGLMLGGISASETDERGWFIDELKSHAETNSITSWEETRDLLNSILWFDGACNDSARKLWDEAKG